MSIKKYSWAYDKRDNIWNSDAFDTVDECVKDAKKMIEVEGRESVKKIYVGENVPFEVYVDAVDVLDLVECRVSDQCGEAGDSWESYNYNGMRDELTELSVRLTAVVVDWLKKNNRMPEVYSIQNIKEVSLTEAPENNKTEPPCKPEVCDTCGREEVCELHEECCSEDEKSCDSHIPKGKEFLQNLEPGDSIWALYREHKNGHITYFIRAAKFVRINFSSGNVMVDVNLCGFGKISDTEYDCVSPDCVFEGITEILKLIDIHDEHTTVHCF